MTYNEMIKSDFSSGFVIRSVVYCMALLVITGMIALMTIDDGSDSFLNEHRYPVATVFFLWMWVGFILLADRSAMSVRLEGDRLIEKRFFGRTINHRYSDITGISTERRVSGAYANSSGYQLLHIEVRGNKLITLSQARYANYEELKSFLYDVRMNRQPFHYGD